MITEQKPHKLKRFLFPVLGAVIAAAAVVVVTVQLGREEPAPAPEPDFHETVEAGTPLVVDFTRPATTAGEYTMLYSACSQYMESYGVLKEYVPVVDVTEDTFIDTGEEPLPDDQPEPDVYTEYDRAYFEDFLMVRYVSEGGDIHVVGARLGGEDRSVVELLDQDAFSSDHFSTVAEEEEEKQKNFWGFSEDKLEGEMEKTGTVSEGTFVSCVGQCVLDMLGNDPDESLVFSHFTEEGAASLLRIIQVMGIDSASAIDIVLAEPGASEADFGIMDRLYLRCEIMHGSEIVYLNLLVKLNSDFIVYDVDTI